VTVSQARVQVTPIEQQGLEADVRRWRSLIEQANPDAETLSRALYDRLVRPVAPQLQARKLLIVPHGVLHYLPFAALHDGQRHLLDSHVLRYLPSASVLRFLKPARAQTLEPVLVFGNPDLGDPRYDLPYAETEARQVAALAAGSELLLRRQATEQAFKQQAPAFRFIHIASHGEFNGADGLQSRLLLAKAGGEDGSLQVAELYGVALDADLVTLSACETGLGKVLSGDDVLGLTRGFLYAGTRNIAASHWQVDDLATSVLMRHFYGALQRGLPKREALRQAQIDTRREFPQPVYWAAFFLTGNGL
jgi:CHAT domain-containing protein